MYTTKFKITNLTCGACVKLSTMALKKIHGVTDVNVDLKTGETELTAEHEIAWGDITEALKEVEKTATNN